MQRQLIPSKAALTALLVALFVGAPAFADDGESTRSPGEISKVTTDISHQIESPYCPGKTLEMCPSGGAAEVRREIQRLAATGRSEDEIKERIIEEYGEEYRLVEPERRDNLTLFVILGAALLLCLLAIWLFSARKGEDPDEETDSTGETDGDLSPQDRAYLDELRDDYLD